MTGQFEGDQMECPQCAEIIKSRAKICRFCRYEIVKEVPKSSGLGQSGMQPNEPEQVQGRKPGRLKNVKKSPRKFKSERKKRSVSREDLNILGKRESKGNSVALIAALSVTTLASVLLTILFLNSQEAVNDHKTQSAVVRKTGRETTELLSLRKKAESGDIFAMRKLGEYYWRGIGTRRNPILAKKWFQRVAEQGSAQDASDMVVLLEQIRKYESQHAEQIAREEEAVEEEGRRIRRLAVLERERKLEQAKAEAEYQKNRLRTVKETIESALAQADSSIKKHKDSLLTLSMLERNADYSDSKLLIISAKRKCADLKDRVIKSEIEVLLSAQSTLKPADTLNKIKEIEDFHGSPVGTLKKLKAEATVKLDQEIEKERLLEKENERKKREAELAAMAKKQKEEAELERQKRLIKSAVTKAATKWFKSRSAKKLLCRSCSGSQIRACSSCDGKGSKRTHSVSGGARAECKSCYGRGRERCDLCLHGYRKIELTNAFWRFLSPTAKSKINKKGMLSSIISGNGRFDIGSSPIVESATIRSIDIRSDSVLVTADVKWDTDSSRWYGRDRFDLSNSSLYKISWVKVGRSFYLKTNLDKGDPLFRSK